MLSHHHVSHPFSEFYLLATLDGNKIGHDQCPLIDAMWASREGERKVKYSLIPWYKKRGRVDQSSSLLKGL